MLTISKIQTVLKESGSKCCKHTTSKCSKTVLAKKNKKFTETIILPKTKFESWLSRVKRIEQDERIIRDCGFATLYNWQRKNITGTEYVLHDGPPYANGMPHMGHAINKILKDITIRNKLLRGQKIHFKPGWDCHGLPIELKAMAGQDTKSLSPLVIRSQARKFAKEAIKDQRALFRSWGVMADWEDGCYFTFEKSYVKNQFQQFYKLYKQGLVYRDVKPVYWSPSSMTALAEAELVYKEGHESQAIYLQVRLKGAPQAWGEVYGMLWTTTPWTLPANQALAFSPTLPYSLVKLPASNRRYLLATPLIAQVADTIGQPLTVVSSVQASELSSLHYEHPLNGGQVLPLLPADHVTADKGTGLVHIAPAHGQDDFKLARKYKLPIVCLVDERGLYTMEAGPSLAGLAVLSVGSELVLQLCQERNTLVHVSTYRHSYPYDWRTNLPVIMRASNQWFFDTSAVKEQAIAGLKNTKLLPELGMAGLMSQVKSRPFWCISRQRVWGVPIPVLYTSSHKPIISKELVDHYCHMLDAEGDDFWWTCSIQDLAPLHLLTNLNIDYNDIERSQDILDIWMDSGLSWSAVLNSPSADLYLEGVDQFNGWFQSSLLTSVALQQTPPYKTIFVHGFAVDEDGRKMSKSLGNVINPQDIMYGGADASKQPTYGVDTLRWWVAAHGIQQANVPVSATTLANSREVVQRLRSVFKFILGALNGLPNALPSPKLYHLDFYMLHCLHELENQVFEQYNNFQYNQVCLTINNFVANQVSALYCHLIKDRLYCEGEDSEKRRAVQLTLFHTLQTISRLIAPILPILAEEVHMHLPFKESEYLFHKVGSTTRAEWRNPLVESLVKLALEVKQHVIRLTPLNCSNWEMAVVVSAPSDLWLQLQALQTTEVSGDSELAEILQVSQVRLQQVDNLRPTTEVQVSVRLVETNLCERCRRHTALTPDLPCPRCSHVLTALKISN